MRDQDQGGSSRGRARGFSRGVEPGGSADRDDDLVEIDYRNVVLPLADGEVRLPLCFLLTKLGVEGRIYFISIF